MAVRVKLRIKSRLDPSRSVESIALVNSGFEADTPQLLIPVKLAEELGLARRLLEARVEAYGTVGGPIRVYVLPSSIEVAIAEEGAPSKVIVADAVISEYEREVLISDYLAGELGIIVEDFKEGVWRLKTDPPDLKRRTHGPQYW